MPEHILIQGPAVATQLMKQLGISQPTLSRRINASNKILTIGKGKATRYALRRQVSDSNNGVLDNFALYNINQQGHATQFGTLYLLWPEENCAVYWHQTQRWQIYQGLPWFLADMRPQGFLGQHWAQQQQEMPGLPSDVTTWSATQTLCALAQQVPDAPGNLIVGEKAYQVWFDQPPAAAIPVNRKLRTYQLLARLAVTGKEVSSYLGGEQAKFTSFVAHENRPDSHVLVKFSPEENTTNSNHAIAQRWADLLIAEHLALTILGERGISAALSTLLQAPSGQVFLEIERFDRLNEAGRCGVVSLAAINAEFSDGNPNDNWAQSAAKLLQAKVITEESQHDVALAYAFGRLIANSDMQWDNLSFLYTEQLPLSMAPIYDMLPMAFAPDQQGVMLQRVPTIQLTPCGANAQWRAAWELALGLAVIYWQNVASSPLISDEFRQLAAGMAQQVEKLPAQIARMA